MLTNRWRRTRGRIRARILPRLENYFGLERVNLELDDFATFCRSRMLRFVQVVLLFIVITNVLWLPTDFWVFTDEATRWGLITFRLTFALMASGASLLLRTRIARENVVPISIGVYYVMATYAFALLGKLGGGPETGLVYTSFIIPMLTLMLLVRPLVRLAVILTACTLAMVAYYLPNPHFLEFPYNGVVWSYLLFTALACTVMGHLIYALEKVAFEQRRALRAHAERLESLDRLKDEFVQTVSHELRTPLNAIIGTTDVVLDGQLSPELRRRIRTIHDSGGVLLHLINDILDLAKIRRGVLDLEQAQVDVLELVESTAGVFVNACEEKGLVLSHHVPASMPPVTLDDRRLRQVLLNLVGNAVKFTDAGEVQVLARLEDVGRDTATLALLVRDTGPGIPSDRRAFVFDEFTQLDPGSTRRHGGTGLGLSIVRRLTQLMGGDVAVHERRPHGSVFSVRLPVTLAPPVPRALPAPSRWLVSHPHPLRRQHVRDVLEHAGAHVTELEELHRTAGAVRDAARRGKPFDGVVLGHAGLSLEALVDAGLVANGRPVAKLVLSMNGRALEQEGPRLRQAGVEHLLPAPLRSADLRAVLQPARAETPRPQVRLTGRRSLLVVDDVRDNRELVAAFLEGQPVDLVFAADGLQAVQRFEEQRFDAVLLDVEMPVLDGYEAVRRMRAHEQDGQRSPVPILALTAHSTEQHERRALEAGFTRRLTKPLRKQLVLEALAELLGPPPKDAEHDGSLSSAVLRLQPRYLGRLRAELPEVRAALARGDFPSVQRFGHRLRGSGGSFALPHLSELGERLEAYARDLNPEGTWLTLTEIEQSVAQTAA